MRFNLGTKKILYIISNYKKNLLQLIKIYIKLKN